MRDLYNIQIGFRAPIYRLYRYSTPAGALEIRNHCIPQRELLVTHLRKACLVRAEALDVFHVLVEIFELLPCRPEHHDGGDVRVGARVAPIRVVVRAHHLRHGDGKLKLPPLVKLQLCR